MIRTSLMFAAAGALSACVFMSSPAFASQDAKPAAKIDPKAMEVGEAALKQFRKARTTRIDITQNFIMRSPMGKQEMTSKFDFASQQPNLFAMELKEGMMGETVISDGKHLFTYIQALNCYIEAEAPAAMDDVLASVMETSGSTGGGPISFLAPILMIGSSADGEHGKLADSVKEAEYKGREEVNGRDSHHVRFVVSPALPDEVMQGMRDEMGDDFSMSYIFSAWIDAERSTVHKIEFDLKEMMKQMMADMPEEMQEEMKEIEYEMSIVFSNWRTNIDIPADRFSFSPPEGVKKVASLMEAFDAGMEDRGPGPDQLLGMPAPDFELETLGGGTLTLAQHRGKDIVVLDFWATWCGPCIRALPGLMEVAEEYKDRNVVLYAVNQREAEETISKFLEQRKWNLKVPLDRSGNVATKYLVGGIPQTVIIDKDGVVEAVHVGYSPGLTQQLRDELDSLLAGRKLAQKPPKSESNEPSDDE
ncbi:MAG TPA: redoxin domain-containing protein [Phycisphaerales bacterium]|nr:redoxin domain-containing protein [Phycisphaerales bacterium]HRQ75375.1 redoxin domain-containing protein [Phycisphaerales bacterium]